MKASVQYNDFKGTAAADISDYSDLTKFLADRGVDTNRYTPIGVEFYNAYDTFYGSIVCVDQQQSTKGNDYVVKISFEAPFDRDQFFMLFKRFNVIVTSNYEHYQDLKVRDEIVIDDREGARAEEV